MNAELKREARARAAQAREAAHAAVGAEAGDNLAARGLPALTGRIVSGFLAYRTEIDVLPLLRLLTVKGWTAALPVAVAKGEPLVFRAWLPGQPTVAGAWGIPVPPEGHEEVLPDVLLVPLLAFDRKGYRLGYGGGFYDRTLHKLRAMKPVTAIGVAYAAQEVDAVPHAPYDQPLDWMMTETETFKCG